MKTFLRIFTTFFILLILNILIACQSGEVIEVQRYYTEAEYAILQEGLRLPNEEINYSPALPRHVLLLNQFKETIIQNDKAQLGRVLFYDKKLSKNGQVSCASCHQQELAFADNKAFSVGFDGDLTVRNSLALASTPGFRLGYNGGFVGFGVLVPPSNFFWDERASSIAQQSNMSLTDPVEMGMENMGAVVYQVQQQPYYQVLFNKAFGDAYPTETRILESLEEFVHSLASTQSRFDQGLDEIGDLHKDFANFTDMENTGKIMYIQHCASCHGSRMTGLAKNVANNGLELDYSDKGRYKVTKELRDDGVFKVPMLRNIALTAPYMHDGRFATLEEVVEHYNSSIQFHPNLSYQLRDDLDRQAPKRLNLTDYQKQALVAFLHTLTDKTFIKDGRFSNPFK